MRSKRGLLVTADRTGYGTVLIIAFLAFLVLSRPSGMRRSDYSGVVCLSLVSFFLCGHLVGAQEPPCTTRKLPVSFRDAQNLPLQNISASDLEAKVHGKPVRIVSLGADTRPHRLVLILDSSGSMGSVEDESPLWNLEMSLARHFFDVNVQRAQLAMLVFNDQVTEQIDFSRGNSVVGETLQQIAENRDFVKTHIKGKTALRDTILQAIAMLGHPSSADAVYVLTDGGDNASHNSTGELNRRLAVSSVRVFAVLLYRDRSYRNRTPEEEMGPQDLSEITHKSGGEILTAAEWRGKQVALSANADARVKSAEMLSRLYQTIFQDRLLTVELPFPLKTNEHWELKLSNAARHAWTNVRMIYPDTLIGCNAEVYGSGRN